MKKKSVIIVLVIIILIIIAGVVFFSASKVDITNEDAKDMILEEYAMVLNSNGDSDNLNSLLYSELELEVSKVSKKSGSIYASCHVSNHDIRSAYSSTATLSDDSTTLNDFNEILKKEYLKTDMVDNDVEVLIEKIGDSYCAKFDEKSFDAFTGGLLTYYKDSKYVEE